MNYSACSIPSFLWSKLLTLKESPPSSNAYPQWFNFRTNQSKKLHHPFLLIHFHTPNSNIYDCFLIGLDQPGKHKENNFFKCCHQPGGSFYFLSSYHISHMQNKCTVKDSQLSLVYTNQKKKGRSSTKILQ